MNKLVKCDDCGEQLDKNKVHSRTMTNGTILDLCNDCKFEFDFATRAGIDEL